MSNNKSVKIKDLEDRKQSLKPLYNNNLLGSLEKPGLKYKAISNVKWVSQVIVHVQKLTFMVVNFLFMFTDFGHIHLVKWITLMITVFLLLIYYYIYYDNNKPLCLCTAHYSITHNCTCYYMDPQINTLTHREFCPTFPGQNTAACPSM